MLSSAWTLRLIIRGRLRFAGIPDEGKPPRLQVLLEFLKLGTNFIGNSKFLRAYHVFAVIAGQGDPFPKYGGRD